MGELLKCARIARSDTLRWNILPWYEPVNAKISASDLACGAGYLSELIAMLPRLRVVVFVGKRAQKAAPIVVIPVGVKVLNCPHSSPVLLHTHPEQRAVILEALKEVAATLRKIAPPRT